MQFEKIEYQSYIKIERVQKSVSTNTFNVIYDLKQHKTGKDTKNIYL